MQFDEDFFKAIGLGNASAEDRAEMVTKLSELVQGRVALKLSEVLNEEQLEQFDSLLETHGDDAALSYIMQVYPEYPQLLQAEVDGVKKQFTSDIDHVMHEIEDRPQTED